VPEGCGIRHFITKRVGDGHQIYTVNELIPSVSRFAYAEGKATYLDTVEIPCTHEGSTAAAIRLSADGMRLYTSVRGENILSVFDVARDGAPVLRQTVDCGGDGPRDFALTDTHLICTNQFSNDVTLFTLEDGLIGKQTDRISLPEPLCVVVKQ
jgi:6-phosphogluconolactonase